MKKSGKIWGYLVGISGIAMFVFWSCLLGGIITAIGLYILKAAYNVTAKKAGVGAFLIAEALSGFAIQSISSTIMILIVGLVLYIWGMVQPQKYSEVETTETFIVSPEMKKFQCTQCGAIETGWYSNCPRCGAVGTIRKGTEDEIKTWNNISTQETSNESKTRMSAQESSCNCTPNRMNTIDTIVVEDSANTPQPQNAEREYSFLQKKNFCTNCGKPLSPNDKFCGECGAITKADM